MAAHFGGFWPGGKTSMSKSEGIFLISLALSTASFIWRGGEPVKKKKKKKSKKSQ